MSSPKTLNLEGGRKSLSVKARALLSSWHEGIYLAARSWQAASLSLTAFGLRGQKKVCQGESKKTAGFLAQEIRWQPHHWPLSGTASMLLLCLLKDGALIAGSILPQAIDDTHPDVGQGADRRTMGLALGAFALIIVPCPGFLSRRLPGKLVESGAQR